MKFLTVLFFMVSFHIGHTQNNLKGYFINIKNLNFNDARTNANSMEDELLGSLLLQLTGVLEKKERPDNYLIVENVTREQLFITILLEGYQELYNEDTSSLEAYKKFSESIKIAEAIQKPYLIKAGLIGMLELLRREVFIGSKQFKPYLEYLKQLKSDATDDIILIFYEIIFNSKADDRLDVSYEYEESLQKLDSIFAELPSDHPYYPFYYHEKGIQFKILGNFELAEFFFSKVSDLTLGDNALMDLHKTNLWQLGDLMMEAGKLEEAKKYLRASRKLSKGSRDIFYDDRLSASIFEKEKRFDSAYYYLNKSVNLEYALGYKNNTLESSILAVQNETDKLRLDTFRLDTERKQNRNWLIAASLALILVLGIAILLQKNTTKKRQLAEQEAILKQQRVENLLKEQELVSIDAMIAGQEKERQKVANELHDDLGSLMATIKLHFDKAGTGAKDPALQNAQKLLEEAYQKIRRMAHSKNSGVMSDQGLLPAIKKMAKSISESNTLQVSVEDFGMGDRLENSLELSIFRMVQELVANAIKHAEASKVNIQLTQHEDNLNIIVEDNGKGFNRSQVIKEKSGMGLTNIEKRVEHLEGNFTVDSVLGKGTSILIDIPV